MADILEGAGYTGVVCDQVVAEALWVANETGQREELPMLALIDNGCVERWTAIGSELDVLVSLAADLGDGEAASLAIAHGRGVAVATDDLPARRTALRLSPRVEVRSTGELLHSWALRRTRDDVAETLRRIEVGASFRPPRQDPFSAWWLTATQSATPTHQAVHPTAVDS